MVNFLGPGAFGAANPSVVRPVVTPANGAGDPDDWAKDCTSPLTQDGTEWRAGLFNQLIALMRSAVRKSGITASNLDDDILSRAIRSQGLNYAVAGGTANAITILPDPAFTSIVVGTPFRILIAAANTGPATLNVNGLGAAPIVTRSGAALAADDLQAGAIETVVWSGTAFMLAGLARSETVTSVALNYYVAPTGSDTNPGTAGAPFLTLQRAVDVGSRVRTIAGSAVNINVANGSYAPFTANVRDTTFNIVGNIATPSSCVIANPVVGSSCASFLGSRATLRGFKLTGTGTGVNAAQQANVRVGNLELGIDGAQATFGYSLYAVDASIIRLFAPVRQLAQSLGAVFVSGAGSTIDLGAQTVTIDALNAILSPGVPGPTAWANGGFINAAGAAFAGAGPNYAKRYQADSGAGSIWTGGGGPNFIPGTVAGTGTYS